MSDKDVQNLEQSSGIVVAGSAIGAVLASSCCILPLMLISLGVGGTWIGTLTGLTVYKPIFIIVTIMFLGLAFWRVYRPASKGCDNEGCATTGSKRVVKTVLFVSTGLTLAALTTDLWAPYFY